MSLKLNRKTIFISIAILLWLLTGCYRDNNHPRYTYYPEMTENFASNSYSPELVATDSFKLKPVKGTVSISGLQHSSNYNMDRSLAGKHFTNPLDRTLKNIKTGKIIYKKLCENCHGEHGSGIGYLIEKQLFPFTPSALNTEKVSALTDGDLYRSFVYGYGVMGAHNNMMTEMERWQVVCYIRELQKQK